MHHSNARYIIYSFIAVFALLTCCTGMDKGSLPIGKSKKIGFLSKKADTIYTQQAAMAIYAYQPKRALQILDSAVIVGNISQWQAEMCRARIYSSTLMREQLNAKLGGPESIGFDSAQAICERLISHDSIKTDLIRKMEVLEILAYTKRMQNDTIGWMQRSRELVDLCHQIGPDAETDALRTEAEIGAALCAIGQEKEGMAKMDSVITLLSEKGMFDKLDALIIALKRKIVILGSHDRYAETLPLARLIIERLDDYEAHPEDFHDGSRREPKNDQNRADYIRFYRNQAQSYITAALASLGEHSDMLTAFRQIEDGVRSATAREHLARYNSLQQQMEKERLQAKANRFSLISYSISALAFLLIILVIVVTYKNKAINRKNRILVQQIAEALNYKEQYLIEKEAHEPKPATSDVNTFTEEQMFQYINEVIVCEKLFLDPRFDRQTIMDRFNLSKERVGAIFSKGTSFTKLTNYVQQLRMEYAAKLLVEKPEMSIVQIASECGFSSNTYFSDRFRMHFSMKPSEFRKARQQS